RGTRARIWDLEAIAARTPPLKSGSYAIAGAKIVDATGRAPIADGVVVIRDGRIDEVGPRSEIRLPRDLPVVDAAGKTIVPGLWGKHTHVTQNGEAPGDLPA